MSKVVGQCDSPLGQAGVGYGQHIFSLYIVHVRQPKPIVQLFCSGARPSHAFQKAAAVNAVLVLDSLSRTGCWGLYSID